MQGKRSSPRRAAVAGNEAAALARASNGYYYAVQLLARAESDSIALRVSNDAGTAVRYRVGEDRFAVVREGGYLSLRR